MHERLRDFPWAGGCQAVGCGVALAWFLRGAGEGEGAAAGLLPVEGHVVFLDTLSGQATQAKVQSPI